MKTIFKKLIPLCCGIVLSESFVIAQDTKAIPSTPNTTSVSAPSPGSWNYQIMTRTEYKHGYQALADTNQKSAISTSQRARIGYNYKSDKFKSGISIQDIRVWGNRANLPVDTSGSLSLYEGWGELMMTDKCSFKFGRQALSYDDDRILGSLDWAMQGRRHDVGLFKYINDSVLTIHSGFAYNQDRDFLKSNVYSVKGNYKAMQFLWLFRQFKSFNISALFLNNGIQFSKVYPTSTNNYIAYSQTFGVRSFYKKDKLQSIAYIYMQKGQDGNSKNPNGDPRRLNAYDVSAEVSYKVVKSTGITLGAEMLSGSTQDATQTKDQTTSFNPFYGTNHRFNGYMDYFYVGNHINSVGLRDIYLKINHDIKKTFIGLNTHMFAAMADIKDVKNSTPTSFISLSKNLGTEIDLTVAYNFTDGIGIQGGYSQIFGTSSLVALRGGNTSQTSNWAYVMILIRPGAVKFPKTGLKL